MSIPCKMNPMGRTSGEVLPPDNEIWYRAPEQITLNTNSGTAGHSFANGKGIVTLLPGRTTMMFWFSSKSSITKIYFGSQLTAMDEQGDLQCLANLQKVILPKYLTNIGEYAFRYSNLPSLKIPDTVTEIKRNAFMYCTGLTEIVIPSAVSAIGVNAFYNITSLAKATFSGTPASIDTTTFSYCNNLADIYVPWSQGAVAGAPWGGANATIHYNCAQESGDL